MTEELREALEESWRRESEQLQRIRELEADLQLSEAYCAHWRKLAPTTSENRELSTALTQFIGASEYMQLKALEVEQQLSLPLPGGDLATAERFLRLRLSLSRAEHAALLKLNELESIK